MMQPRTTSIWALVVWRNLSFQTSWTSLCAISTAWPQRHRHYLQTRCQPRVKTWRLPPPSKKGGCSKISQMTNNLSKQISLNLSTSLKNSESCSWTISLIKLECILAPAASHMSWWLWKKTWSSSSFKLFSSRRSRLILPTSSACIQTVKGRGHSLTYLILGLASISAIWLSKRWTA